MYTSNEVSTYGDWSEWRESRGFLVRSDDSNVQINIFLIRLNAVKTTRIDSVGIVYFKPTFTQRKDEIIHWISESWCRVRLTHESNSICTGSSHRERYDKFFLLLLFSLGGPKCLVFRFGSVNTGTGCVPTRVFKGYLLRCIGENGRYVLVHNNSL